MGLWKPNNECVLSCAMDLHYPNFPLSSEYAARNTYCSCRVELLRDSVGALCAILMILPGRCTGMIDTSYVCDVGKACARRG